MYKNNKLNFDREDMIFIKEQIYLSFSKYYF